MRVPFTLILLIALLLGSCSNEPDTRRLTTSSVPTEAGSVTPEGGNFEIRRNIEISAFPNDNWVFERWEGDHTGTENPVVISMDSDKDIAAIFAKRDYSLTVNIDGEGSVTERIVQQKATDYPHGTVVELTAEPDNNWEFVEWEGDLDGSENPATITIEENAEVTAVFSPISYPLTVNIQGQGSVDEEIVQTKTTDYPYQSVVELTAIPDTSWAFVEWEGDLQTDENPAQITIDEAKTVTAIFDRLFTLTTLPRPEEGGVVEPSNGEYVRDTSFDVEAIPNDGWRFVEWRGDFTGTTNPFNLTMNGNKTIEAYFEPLEYSLSTNIEGEGNVLLDVLSGGELGSGYEFGSVIEVTAVPTSGWRFIEWQGDLSGSANPTTITIDDSKSITAVFEFFDGGDGTVGNPYQISRLDQVQAVQDNLDTHFILMGDIDASSTGSGDEFIPIGDNGIPFTGSFDGNGFTISELTINRPVESNVGLFGVIGEGATVENLYLESATISGANEVGVLAGINNGNIIQSYSTGTVNGTDNVGGLSGQNNGLMQLSFSSASITAANNVGGLVGTNTATILSGYAVGSVNGNTNVGGLAGSNTSSGQIDETYAAGSVSGVTNVGGLIGLKSGTVTSSYWDNNLITGTGQVNGTGSGDSTGMTGLSTSEMQGPAAQTNMTDFNWVETWVTTSGGYPIFQWLVE